MKKGDKIVMYIVTILLVLSIVSVIFYKRSSKSEKAVGVIKQNSKVIERIDLSKVKEKRQFRINYSEGSYKGYNIIEVDKGSIRFI